jgi:glycosyltransferase involved in cell wall biosynthesis
MLKKDYITFTFLFPRTGEIPIGGFKVVFEYANRLVADGHRVNIIYGIVSRPVENIIIRLGYYFCRVFRWLKYLLFKEYKANKWFPVDKRINQKLKYSLSEKGIPASDIIIATSWSTSVWLDRYKKISNSHKIYFIQSFEEWNAPPKTIIATWKQDMTKIVISPWLQDIADGLNEQSVLIENGFDQDEFYITVPIEKKNRMSIVMLWHDNPIKASDRGLQALLEVKKKYPQLTASFFGTPERPAHIPQWVSYFRTPSRHDLLNVYNSSAIFAGPSKMEGWALTVCEAMLCGCAVACTNIGGYKVVAKDNETALLSEPDDIAGLAANIIRLIEDDAMRYRLAQAGGNLVKTFTWQRSYQKFINVINNAMNEI